MPPAERLIAVPLPARSNRIERFAGSQLSAKIGGTLAAP
jgi:hypothetical protein